VRLWLANPQAVKPGCHMPDFHLAPDEVQALAAYLETLK
jgi:cytochrome c oxidase subunit 2